MSNHSRNSQQMASEITFDGDTFLAALLDEEEDDLINFFASSVAEYIERLELQEIFMDSTIKSSGNPAAEEESSGEPSLSFCEICAERKEDDQMFQIPECNHFFCNQCINKHVETKLQQSIDTVECPAADCTRALHFESCKAIMSEDVIAKWDKALCESLIPDDQKFYCPFKDCSAMLLKDTEEVIREAECPICWRLFCGECRAPWHSEIGCAEFQAAAEGERDREDFLLRELVKEKEWRRCPRCKFYVEKISGCLHISCRCGFQFCYACGGTWSLMHGCMVWG